MFHFKKFSLDDDKSSMKVGTDSVLLSSIIHANGVNKILDIGTGCGIIALMLAQKTDANIFAVEIDHQSCSEAGKNFELSPWKNRLNLIESDIISFAATCTERFELIVSNPPFFHTGERKKNISKSRARHIDFLDFDLLCKSASTLLERNGIFSVIIPCNRTENLVDCAASHGLQLKNIYIIHTYYHQKPVRHIAQFSFDKHFSVEFDRLILRETDGKYSEKYRKITEDYLLDRSFR